ncbi:ATPase SWSAP1 isoform X2 [Dromiciops gliroides]|uniref:ATPase SWSAP1 isoform X2 n=1 Tax=Dromiciops gliroides TaxID=33562 RepID=UPI001CC58EDE|nr:ATPase SWSAP1 isoform X2 [Dromiciops gliroides]
MEVLRLLLSPGAAVGRGECATGEGTGLLLLGESGSGKTALLFAAALVAAGEGRGPVLFVTRRALQSLPPAWKASAARDPLRLQIHFLYPASLHELPAASELHARNSSPGSVPPACWMGLDEYLAEASGPHACAHLAALLVDTVTPFLRPHEQRLRASGHGARSPPRPRRSQPPSSWLCSRGTCPTCLWLEPEPPDWQEAGAPP